MHTTLFSGWTNFYVIVGSAAGALIGLQFVVMALLADLPTAVIQAQAGHAFATPTVVHFGAVLFLSAVACAPWGDIYIYAPALIFCVLGICGIGYCLVVIRRMRSQTIYTPEFEDWLFHFILPCAAYSILAISGFVIRVRAYWPMFGVAVAVLLLLFVGIHNAWDAATYHLFLNGSKGEKSGSPPE